MAQTFHRVIDNPALPYRSYMSPTFKEPCWTAGSRDVMTSLKRVAEKRPGFSTAIEDTPTAFENLQRLFGWQKWGGDYILMFCDVTGSGAKVYGYRFGTDTSAVLLHTSASTTPFDFVVENNWVKFGNGTDMKMWPGTGTTVYTWGITAPSAVPTVSLGGTGIDAASGYYYRTTFSSTITGQESSPSGASACTGTFTNNTATVTLNAANADAQVTHWNLYRTTDGGSYDPLLMKRVAQIAIGTTTYADSTADGSLGTTVAPALLRNDPPPASTCFAWSQGRIAMKDATTKNKVWLTGLEEIAQGVPSDCVPSGQDGNYWSFAREVSGIAPTPSGFAIFFAKDIDKIDGDTLDSLKRGSLVKKRGSKSHVAIDALGGTVAWFDTAGQVWNSEDGEIGEAIRTDTKTIDQTQVQICIHISGEYHWIVLADGANGKLYVYDLDTKQWMPPWNVGTTITALASVEVADGMTELVIGLNGTDAVKMTPSLFDDNGTPYQGDLVSNLIDIHPDANPEWVGIVDQISVEHNGQEPTVSQLNDDDVSLGTFTPLTPQDPTRRSNGQYIVQSDYPSMSAMSTDSQSATARRIAFRQHWEAAPGAFKVYSAKVQWHPVGT